MRDATKKCCQNQDGAVREPFVSVQDVCKSYGSGEGKAQVLKDLSLEVAQGELCAILGASGSGKSTLATLIARFADPDAGAIRIGGVDLRDMGESTLYSTVSFVLQDAQLLGTTVRENIALGRPDADLDQVRAAARVARIDEEIMALPDGYDTVLGRDTGLSGGQEQRIAIARAILLNTPVILLDEATAMADPESEAEIQEALSALVKDRTVLVIAHRPAAVRGADRIVVMKNGVKVADGSMDELHVQSGLPLTVNIRLKSPRPLSERWQPLSDDLSYQAQCQAEERMALLSELGNLSDLAYLDIHTPTLDDMYAQFLKREDV